MDARRAALVVVALLLLALQSDDVKQIVAPRARDSGARADAGADLRAADDAATTVDLVIVFTVWKRPTLAEYFYFLERQDVFRERGPRFRVHVVVFQNGGHLDVKATVAEWSARRVWGTRTVTVTHIHSPLATGYFGRFLVPLLSAVRENSYWVVADDDVAWGAHYISNMLRVVDGGRLAVRVGRFVYWEDSLLKEHMGSTGRGGKGVEAIFEDDVRYDFGGQLWAGRISWLRKAWAHPPTTLVTAEDFWISAVLSSFYGIATARPRCPAADLEACACSMQIASEHFSAEIGNQTGGEGARSEAFTKHAAATYYKPLGDTAIAVEAASYLFRNTGSTWDLEGTVFADCLFFM